MGSKSSGKPGRKTHCPQGHPYTPENTLLVKDSHGGYFQRCKKCHTDYERNRKQGLRDKNPKPPRNPYAGEGKKQCTMCFNIKPFKDFHVSNSASDGRVPRCKECLREQRIEKERARYKAPEVIIESDMKKAEFASLAKTVSGRLNIVYWDLSDREVVESLSSGLPKDGAVHVFSDEWVRRMDQCTGFIRARAGLFDRKVWARKCDVRQVPKDDAKEFVNRFHIQGFNRLGLAFFGIYDGDELAGLLSLGRHSRKIDQSKVVLDRLCFKAGVQVVGGASKLMKRAVEWATGEGYYEIITFSDNRWTDGKVYESLGFGLERKLRPDYCYVRSDGSRLSKQSQRKGLTECPENMTEREWAEHRGLRRVVDVGKVRWVRNLRPDVHRTRNELSSERARGNHTTKNIRGYFYSEKNGCSIYFASSYELRCVFLLEKRPDVVAFRRCEPFVGESGWRNPDLRVEFADGRSEVWEIKPKSLLDEPEVLDQIRDSEVFTESIGVEFKVWTEEDSGLDDYHHISKWAREYLEKAGEQDISKHYKESRKRTRERYYAKVKEDKVEVWCDFCQTVHVQMKMTYEQNLKRNDGKYVCGRYGGHLAGKKPKDHLKVTNPYADEGKKQCSTCGEVKPFDEFWIHRSTWDGRNPRCKECWKKKKLAKGAELEGPP